MFKVLDFSKLLPGPLASKILMQEHGAHVIKIENPNSPDMTRFYPPLVDGDLGVNYVALNEHKPVEWIDYRSPEGRAQVLAMAADADVVIEQFRPGIMAKMGLSYDDFKTVNQRIIYVSITGYGQTGPLAHRAGHDLNYLAYSGVLSLTVDADGTPVIPGVQIADVAGGAYRCVSAVLGALYNREKTGSGTWIDISMLEGLRPLMTLNQAQYYAGEEFPAGSPTMLSGRLPNYNVYRCADDRFIALAALEPKFWNHFCALVNRPDWVERFFPISENIAYLKVELTALFLTRTRDEWVSFVGDADVCLSPVLEIGEHN